METRQRKICPACRYAFGGLDAIAVDFRCPECGLTVPEAVTLRARHWRRRIGVALTVLLLAAAWFVPWLRVMPTKALLLVPVYSDPWHSWGWCTSVRNELLSRLAESEGSVSDRRRIAEDWIRHRVKCQRLTSDRALVSFDQTLLCFPNEVRQNHPSGSRQMVDIASFVDGSMMPPEWVVRGPRFRNSIPYWYDPWMSLPRRQGEDGITVVYCVAPQSNVVWGLPQHDVLGQQQTSAAGTLFIPFESTPPTELGVQFQESVELDQYLARALRCTFTRSQFFGPQVWLESVGPRPRPDLALGLVITARRADDAALMTFRCWDNGALFEGLMNWLPWEGDRIALLHEMVDDEARKGLTFEIRSDAGMALRDPGRRPAWKGVIVVKFLDAYVEEPY